MSKFMYFDFRCRKCDLKSEQFVKPDIQQMSCPNCDGTMVRCISAPSIKLPGTDPAFPGEWNKWEKARSKRQKEDAKFYKEHGVDKLHHSYGS